MPGRILHAMLGATVRRGRADMPLVLLVAYSTLHRWQSVSIEASGEMVLAAHQVGRAPWDRRGRGVVAGPARVAEGFHRRHVRVRAALPPPRVGRARR